MSEVEQSTTTNDQDRLPYVAPELTVQGKVADLTLGSNGNNSDTHNGSAITSDVHAKHTFGEVDPTLILQRLAALPVTSWAYLGETARHIGPMAQDFAAAFGLGSSDRMIDTVDAFGVLVASLQAMAERSDAQQLEIDSLRGRLETVERAKTVNLT